MSQKQKAAEFGALHQKGNPVIIYNIWDAGTAKAVSEAGAKALGTGSWSVAAAHGYADGEKLPLEVLLATARSITSAVGLPLSVDFEGGYAEDPHALADNVGKLIDTGAIGMNFEDQVVGGTGIYPAGVQAKRIEAVRALADQRGIPFFINARTDLFLKESDRAQHAGLLDDAIARGRTYASAGASGFFAPGLADDALIAKLCEAVALPVNIMMMGGVSAPKRLAELGVGRVSYGPGPYRSMMARLQEEAAAVFSATA
jgi:2-methylisocitrate lyase-like PEP mutase family enzyme